MNLSAVDFIGDGRSGNNENIKAANLSIDNTGSVGSNSNKLMLELPDDGILYAKASGNIYICELTGNINLKLASSNSGDVYLKANNSLNRLRR